MKLLITGGAGFIGSAVVRAALGTAPTVRKSGADESPHAVAAQVVNVDSLELYSREAALYALPPLSDRHIFHQLNITDANALDSVFRSHDPDAVVHLAAETHVDHSIRRPLDFVNANVAGTYNLLQASLGHWQRRGRPESFRFLHVSTDEVFGSLGQDGRFSEKSRYDPRNPYSATKAASDHLVRAWHHTYGLPVLISNCSNNFGPFQFPDKLIPRIISRAIDGQPIPIFGSGKQVRDWIFVEDHAAALLAILDRGQVGRSYNVGAENETTNIKIAKLVCGILDRLRPSGGPHTRLISFVGDRPGHDTRYAIDPARIRSELDWVPLVGLEAGLEATVQWYLQHQSWWRPLLAPTSNTEATAA